MPDEETPDEDRALGVETEIDDNVRISLGRMITSAATVEKFSDDIARGLGIPKSREQISRTLKRARAQAKKSMPPWARVSSKDVIEWIDGAISELDERNKYVHASPLMMATDSGWEPVHISLRDGSVMRLTTTDIDRLVNRLKARASVGLDVSVKLAVPTKYGRALFPRLPIVQSRVELADDTPPEWLTWPDESQVARI